MAVFGGIADRVFHYNANTGGWDYAVLEGARWTGNLERVEEGQGYWVNSLVEGSLVLEILSERAAAPRAGYSLPEGWNMIGYISHDLAPSASVNVYLASLSGAWTSLYRYTPSVGYELRKPGSGFPTVEIGRGYLLYLNSASTLVP